ncbi:hypothetical protein [Hoeflea sp. 108]|jgi:hypothetical protein|uniref:hypothetical protein n=1 Tax=Hoeflea sp. 108 TaxID=1116369 RepID=UPI0009DA2EFA|nr:hypothetical protein [Hoeflea sp. 108]
MTRYVDETERAQHNRAKGVWDNDDGVSVRAPIDEQYGRRIEADRSWTIYHVFTGVPASREGLRMIGLSRSVATDGMLSLNRRNDRRRIGGMDGLLRVPFLKQAARGDRQ